MIHSKRPFSCETKISRSANILIDMGDGRPPVKIGEMGVLHPDVLTKFQLGYPVSCMEIDLEMFVDITD